MIKPFAKTKILATIGPACDSEKTLLPLIESGVDGLRINFSHGSFEYFEKVFDTINKICVKKSLPIPILIDLQGPKIRIGELSLPSIELHNNETIEITTEDVLGTYQKVSTSYKSLPQDARIGDLKIGRAHV